MIEDGNCFRDWVHLICSWRGQARTIGRLPWTVVVNYSRLFIRRFVHAGLSAWPVVTAYHWLMCMIGRQSFGFSFCCGKSGMARRQCWLYPITNPILWVKCNVRPIQLGASRVSVGFADCRRYEYRIEVSVAPIGGLMVISTCPLHGCFTWHVSPPTEALRGSTPKNTDKSWRYTRTVILTVIQTMAYEP